MKYFKHQKPAERIPLRLVSQLNYRLGSICGLLLISLLMCLTLSLFAFNQQQQIGHQSEWLNQEVNTILTAMINQETGVRGYVATDDPLFLEPFHMGVQEYHATLLPLQKYLHQAKLSREQVALAQVDERAQAWDQTFALPQIRALQAGDYITPRADATNRRGKVLFDAFRLAIHHLQTAMDDDLLTRDARTQIPIGNIFIIVALFAIGIFLIFCWFVTHLSQDLTHQFDALKHTAWELEMQHLSARVAPLKYEETNMVGQTFNRMAEALQGHQQSLAQMVKDLAAHSRDLEQAHSESSSIVDAINEALFLLASDGRVLSVNRCFREFFSPLPDDLFHQSFDTLRSWWTSRFADPAQLSEWLEQSLSEQEQSLGLDLIQTLPVRRELEFYSTAVHTTENCYLGRLYVMRDVTYEHELERTKRDFVAQVSHELRTPLTSIKGFVDLLLEEPEGLNDEQQEFLGIVQENAQRLKALVNDLLDISRIEAGKMVLERVSVSLNPLIRSSLQSFTPLIANKHQKMEVQLAEPSPVVFADPTRVQQIINNLVSNAHKYTLDGGTLRITTQVDNQDVSISVQDSGIGMTRDEQAQLFTQFFRAKNRQTADVGGTGLGLVITRSLVELHGGMMHVESQPGQGSTFRLTLPLAAESLQPMPTNPSQSRKKRLLVVDDDPDIAYLLQRTCERHNYEVLIARTGQEALTQASQEHPDLILLDIQLPDQHGLTILEQLRSKPNTAGIPVLLVSIMDPRGQGRSLGVIDYLPKPFHEQDLLTCIHNLLNKAPSSLLLLVDDPQVQEFTSISKYLQQKGYTLVIATDGTQIVPLVQRHRPAIILLDSNLSPNGALSVLQTLRAAKEPAICELPVIVLGMQAGALGEQWTIIENMGGAEIVGRACQVEEVVEAITQRLAIGVQR